MMLRTLSTIALALLLAACAHMGASQVPVSFTMPTPEGWRQIATDEPMVFLTKEGGYKQFILAQERPLNKPFEFTKRMIDKGMSPAQAAEVVLRELVSDPNITNFSLLENTPATIGGKSAFRIVFLYTDADGFVFKTVYCGLISGELFYSVRYGATKDEYFEKDIKTYESVLKSFAVRPPK